MGKNSKIIKNYWFFSLSNNRIHYKISPGHNFIFKSKDIIIISKRTLVNEIFLLFRQRIIAISSIFFMMVSVGQRHFYIFETILLFETKGWSVVTNHEDFFSTVIAFKISVAVCRAIDWFVVMQFLEIIKN